MAYNLWDYELSFRALTVTIDHRIGHAILVLRLNVVHILLSIQILLFGLEVESRDGFWARRLLHQIHRQK